MKKLNLIILIITILSSQLAVCQGRFEKIKKNKADKSKIEFALMTVDSFFMTLKARNYYNFSGLATMEFMNNMTPEFQKQSYNQIKQEFGDYKSMKHSSLWVQKDNQELLIIRFKGKFVNSKEPVEIRVVLNSSDKISGLWVRPWEDDIND